MNAPARRPKDRAERLAIRVRGLVQGVGFRPHVHRLATRLGLTGHVLNDPDGVYIEVQGFGADAFTAALVAEAPPLARIDEIVRAPMPMAAAETGFAIRESARGGVVRTAVTPDACVCSDCLAELFDPADRRHLYPFVNCTNCGPRFTITRRLPYDRAETSMAPFPMCEACEAEYRDPTDRRFHAEPVACPTCGPKLSHTPVEIARLLAEGRILAIKGLGGYHLACDARNAAAVAELRLRKRRDGKPFAVMVQGLAAARRLARIGPEEAAALVSPARPVVVAEAREPNGLAPAVTNGLPTLGLFLPVAPHQVLIFHAAAGAPAGTAWMEAEDGLALVMTSANLSGDPLVTDDAEAAERLAGLADVIVSHDRAIVTRADDSVVRVVDGAPLFLRRARGHVPTAIRLARAVPPILAVGGYLKTTVCVTRGDEAFVSQHVGSLDTPRTIEFLAETIEHLTSILEVKPAFVAHDLHPDFPSTHFAEASGLPMVPVQHHVAHVAAVAAEHRLEGPVLGLALDGHGMGPGGASWGGELLLVDGARWTRLGHLLPIALPGGDRAAREPWRMGAALLHLLGRGDEIATTFAEEPLAPAVARLLAQNGPLVSTTTSMGRWFDAFAAFAGFRKQSFEAEAPVRLEAAVGKPQVVDGGYTIRDGVLDLRVLASTLTNGAPPPKVADWVHGSIVAACTDWVAEAARESGVKRVVLGGGCFLNRHLAEGLMRSLKARGLDARLPRQLPPNDGGIALGQAWIAASTVG